MSMCLFNTFNKSEDNDHITQPILAKKIYDIVNFNFSKKLQYPIKF